MRILAPLCSVIWLSVMPAHAQSSDTVHLYAAGSLRAALTAIAKAFESATGTKIEMKYGASGLLRDEIAGGARADVFASANMEHPLALMQAGKSGPVVRFARNRLCALVRPNLAVEPATLLERMVDQKIRLGTSTPKSDPSGDYAWEVFRKADAIRPGAFATLDKKALQLTGGPTSAPAPADRSPYGAFVADGTADIFLTYCTNAMLASRENPGQRMVALPDELAVGADYGLTVLSSAPTSAYGFAMFVLSGEGQRVLAEFGFQ
jgi:molybdate transport system substrate-binding protein